MKIRTKLRIGYLTTTVVVLVAGIIIFSSFKEMHTAGEMLQQLDSVEQVLFELNIVGSEFLIYHEERPKVQWQKLHQTLRHLLQAIDLDDPEDRSLHAELIADLETIETVFTDIVASYLIVGHGLEVARLRQKKNRLNSHLLLKSQKMLANITSLKKRFSTEHFTLQQTTNWISLALILVLALSSLIIGLGLSRSISHPIHALIKSTSLISRGDLSHRLKSERQDEVGRLSASFNRMTASLIAQRHDREQAERNLTERLAFEQLLSELSSSFTRLPASQSDTQILGGLARVGDYLAADRVFLFRFNWDRSEFSISHLWVSEGIDVGRAPSGTLIKDVFPWLYENLTNGRDIVVPDVKMLPGLKANEEYAYCRQIGIQSFLVLPLQVADAPLCAIGLDAVRSPRIWSSEEQDRLRLIGEVFANAIDRQHSEQWVAAAELKYRTVADYTFDWEYWENPDGSLRYISPSCERISGYAIEDFESDPALLEKIIVPQDRQLWETHRCNVRERKQNEGIQFRIQHKDGQIRWIEHVCQPVTDNQGNDQGIRVSNRDITQREHYKSETLQLQSQVAHMDRVVTISALTVALAHEINQPLAAMRSYAQAALRFLANERSDYDMVKKALQGIVADNKRAAAVVNRLRSLVEKSPTQWERLKINAIVNEVLGLLNSEIVLRNAIVDLDLNSDVLPVDGDPIQIQQVLINLVTNALDAVEEVPVGDRSIAIATKTDNKGMVVVEITDAGKGISTENADLIFEPFHTTKVAGMGLGLAICKTIVEAHGGCIRADNNSDGGATLSISLPACS